MRLFIALPFEAQILDSMTDVQSACRAAGVRGNFTKRENLHLTLAFLGEVRDPRPVTAAIRRVPAPQITLSFSRQGLFRDILVAEFVRNAQLDAYVKSLRAALDDAGISYDRKPFRPHVTLIRRALIPDGADMRSLFSPMAGLLTQPSEVRLMRTDFIDGRPKYTCLYAEPAVADQECDK
ncbi:MAG: RNA 2',3'-cyclic phosphodiesterase [Clostridia bacterium]|nr:RNA 2',3'-cyclic phosphodiesterase [Clostridia bacterium]